MNIPYLIYVQYILRFFSQDQFQVSSGTAYHPEEVEHTVEPNRLEQFYGA